MPSNDADPDRAIEMCAVVRERVGSDIDLMLDSHHVTQDLTAAKEFLDRIEAGVAKVNEKPAGLKLHVPFGGYEQSSTNTYREQGDAGVTFFTSTKPIYRSY